MSDDLREKVAQALATTFWEVPHDGDQMFDALAAVALDVALTGMDDLIAKRVSQFVAHLGLPDVIDVMAERDRYRLELTMLTTTRQYLLGALCDVVVILSRRVVELEAGA